jgi:pimeloyl-ACP methyl ester carboxylesterase
MENKWHSISLQHGIHAFTGGDGEPMLLLPGWPQTAEAYSEIFPYLSQRYRIFALDPPGLGDSVPSPDGYDTAAISRLLEESIRSVLPNRSYHLVGHDVGAWIAYAWAAQFPDSVKSLTILDSAIPGYGPPLSYPLPQQVNLKLWQFSFNSLPELPEILTQGKEKEILTWLFDRKSEHPDRITQAKRERYIECYSRPGGMSNGFAYYRAVTQSATQNKEFAKEKLKMPVLALGGESAVGEALKALVTPLGSNVRGGTVANCGHYVVEEQPETVARLLLSFLDEFSHK